LIQWVGRYFRAARLHRTGGTALAPQVSRETSPRTSSFSLTPNFSWVQAGHDVQNRFNGFPRFVRAKQRTRRVLATLPFTNSHWTATVETALTYLTQTSTPEGLDVCSAVVRASPTPEGLNCAELREVTYTNFRSTKNIQPLRGWQASPPWYYYKHPTPPGLMPDSSMLMPLKRF
jgi:hypothetical protein